MHMYIFNVKYNARLYTRITTFVLFDRVISYNVLCAVIIIYARYSLGAHCTLCTSYDRRLIVIKILACVPKIVYTVVEKNKYFSHISSIQH